MARIRDSFGLFGWLTCGNAKAYLRPKSGSRSGPPKCHHSTQYVGRSKVLDLVRIWARIQINVAQIGPVLVYFIYLFSWLIFGLPMACLWPKFANSSGPPKCHHSTQYVGRSKVLDLGWIWTRIKINVARIWASPALFGLFMADIGPSFGLLVAQIWQTGVDCPSAIIPESVRCGPDLGLRSFAIWVLCVMLITLCLFFLKLYMSLDLSYLAYYLIYTGSINCN